MAFKIFVDGNVFEAADANDYLMEQAVIACTSATRPASPNEGMTIYETDTDLLLIYNGTSWIAAVTHQGWTDYSGSLSWTSTGTNPAIGNGSIVAQYARWGRLIIHTGSITMGSTTTFGTGSWLFSHPVTAKATLGIAGGGSAEDASALINTAPVGVRANSTTQFALATVGGECNASVPFTWAQSDILQWLVISEAAA